MMTNYCFNDKYLNNISVKVFSNICMCLHHTALTNDHCEKFRNRILAWNEAYTAETLNQTNGNSLSNIRKKINTYPSLHTQ